jgi:lactoylglutathione lyase
MKLGYVLLYVNDVEQTMRFYEKAFGLKMGFLHEAKDYGEMITGETALGFVSHALVETHGFKYDKVTLKTNPPPNEIALVTPDVEKAYIHAISNGAVSLSKPTKKPWGQTVALVRDLNGFIVEIASPIGV